MTRKQSSSWVFCRAMAIVVGITFLAAAGLKIYKLTHLPVGGRGSWAELPAVVAVLPNAELILAGLLISGLAPVRTRRIASGVLGCSACFALAEALRGQKNCG